MKIRPLLYLLTVFILLISYLITGTYYIAVIFLLMVLLAILSGICMCISYRKIHVKVCEENGKWYVSYVSDTCFPLGTIHIFANVYNSFFGVEEIIHCNFNVGSKKMYIPLAMDAKLGQYTMLESSVILQDMLGIFSKKIDCLSMEDICICPKMTPSKDVSDIQHQLEQRYNEKADDYDVRDYRIGDVVKDIHHKMSYKMSKLMVKEKVKMHDQNIQLLLDLSEDEQSCIQVLTYFHYFMECLQFYDEPCTVYWYVKDKLHEGQIKTLMDKEQLIRKILSLPKAEIMEDSDAWIIHSMGITKGETYE